MSEWLIEKQLDLINNLTAENARLQADVEKWRMSSAEFEALAHGENQLAAGFNAELTKARELLTKLLPWMERANEKSEDADIPESLELRAYLARQSAPAAKGGE